MFAAAVSLLAGGLLGLSLAAPPGPMNAVIAEESVNSGVRAGLAAGLGAMFADVCFFVLALAGVTTVVQEVPTLRAVMVGAGGLLMCYFAYGAARSATAEFVADDVAARAADPVAGFRKAFVLALTNPFQVVWWLTVGVFLLEPGTVSVLGYSVTVASGVLTVVGFFAGVLLWVTAFPVGLRVARNRVSAIGPAVAYGSALLLAGFGVFFCYDAARSLLL
ncbi:LysE family translocator [Halospeciosus flavus]|uniref:LysE family translocator n=1 Tax=Halospeciosus flavus TaxID=3032283 RepID=A0ABD5Z4S4_9EURY|nr:LysE family translocator [Halospeciosus flavus]